MNLKINDPMIIVIGGFVLNDLAIKSLRQISNRVKFIDINTFEAPFDINIATNKVIEMIESYEERVLLCGYSTGGLIAIKIANIIPDILSKVILINSTPRFLSDDNWHGIKLDDFSRLEQKLENMSLEQFKQYFSTLAMHPYRDTELSKLLSETTTKGTLANWLQIIKTTDLKEELADISVEMLAIYAANDHLVPNSNTLGNNLFNKYTLQESSHANLNTTELITKIKEFVL
jgi:pimeloyl-ACP methyl ester carboxylesterase